MNDRLNSGCSNVFLVIVLICGYLIYQMVQCGNSSGSIYDGLTAEQLDSVKQIEYMNNLKSSAASTSRRYVRETLKFPKTADFPVFDIPSKHLGDSVFLIQSYVESQNSFGVVGTLYYDAKIKYLGGSTYEPENWLLIDLKTGDHQ